MDSGFPTNGQFVWSAWTSWGMEELPHLTKTTLKLVGVYGKQPRNKHKFFIDKLIDPRYEPSTNTGFKFQPIGQI